MEREGKQRKQEVRRKSGVGTRGDKEYIDGVILASNAFRVMFRSL